MAVLIGHESHKGAVWAVKRSRMLNISQPNRSCLPLYIAPRGRDTPL